MIKHKDATKHQLHLKSLRGNMRLFDSKESGNDFLEYCAKEQGAGMKKAVAPLAAKKHDATKPNHTMQQQKQVGNKRDREYRRSENKTAIGSVKNRRLFQVKTTFTFNLSCCRIRSRGLLVP